MSDKGIMLLTCAGESKRYDGWGPKWRLTHPSGNLMAAEAARPFAERWTPHVVVLEVGPTIDKIYEEFSKAGMPDTKIVTLDRPTKHRMETVRLAMETICPSDDTPILVRDCDNLVAADIRPGDNAVSVCDVLKHGPVNPKELSFVDNRGGVIWRIAEHDLVTRWFCSGAYALERASLLTEKFSPSHATMADTMQELIARSGGSFKISAVETTRYADWGTADKWRSFKRSYRTLFLDVDGVLLRSSHRSFGTKWGAAERLLANGDALRSLYATGRVHVVLCTSRPESGRIAEQLKHANIPYDKLIMGLPACGRLLVNDVVPERNERTADAVEVPRDVDGGLADAFREAGLIEP